MGVFSSCSVPPKSAGKQVTQKALWKVTPEPLAQPKVKTNFSIRTPQPLVPQYTFLLSHASCLAF